MPPRPRIIIAIPVKNEEARIGLCLERLVQQEVHFDRISLLLNNCTDLTLRICENFAKHWGKIEILQCELSAHLASAGEARRLILNHSMAVARDGVILTTDADAIPGENWVKDNLRALERGADVICGMAKLDSYETAALPAELIQDENNEASLMLIQDEIASMTHPDPIDPWPRHQQRSGASLAMRAQLLRQAGGAPSIASGEDRALVERLQRIDARVRHAPEITVHVSGRLDGRAEGGMATTLKRRSQQRDSLADERLEPTVDAYRRALTRARLRAVIAGFEDPARFAEDILISAGTLRTALQTPYYGEVWTAIERASPILRRRRVAFANLPREIRQAATLLDQLRAEAIGTHISRARRNKAGNLFDDENAG